MISDVFTNGMYDIVNEENIDLNRATREVGKSFKVLFEKKGLGLKNIKKRINFLINVY